jgi:hypothetical protein
LETAFTVFSTLISVKNINREILGTVRTKSGFHCTDVERRVSNASDSSNAFTTAIAVFCSGGKLHYFQGISF